MSHRGGRVERKVIRLSYEEAKPFILGVHYARRMPCVTDAFGLLKDGYLCGVVTYGVPASPSLCKGVAGEANRDRVRELNRLVVVDGERNDASYLVSHSLDMLQDGTFVVSYADAGAWGHVGYIYQATNFMYTGVTKERTDKYVEGGGHSRHYDPNETRRQPRSAKHRYLFLVGNRRSKRDMARQLRYRAMPYPKGESRRYDTTAPIDLYGNATSEGEFSNVAERGLVYKYPIQLEFGF